MMKLGMALSAPQNRASLGFNKRGLYKMNKVCSPESIKINFLFMDEKAAFSGRLKQAMANAGYPVRPIVLEREFNARYWGHPITVQAVRRRLRGEAIPAQDKLQILAEWLQVEPQALHFRGTGQNSRQRAEKALGRSGHRPGTRGVRNLRGFARRGKKGRADVGSGAEGKKARQVLER
jgi:hypothetical protein